MQPHAWLLLAVALPRQARAAEGHFLRPGTRARAAREALCHQRAAASPPSGSLGPGLARALSLKPRRRAVSTMAPVPPQLPSSLWETCPVRDPAVPVSCLGCPRRCWRERGFTRPNREQRAQKPQENLIQAYINVVLKVPILRVPFVNVFYIHTVTRIRSFNLLPVCTYLNTIIINIIQVSTMWVGVLREYSSLLFYFIIFF